MPTLRTLLRAGALGAAALATTAAPASAVVGGTDAPAGKYPSTANVTIAAAFGCTGTLIAPTWVLTAGHCGSITGGTGVATPASFPGAAFDVTVNTTAADGTGGERLRVASAHIPTSYLATQGSDVTLLKLSAPARTAPTPVAGAALGSLWAPGVLTEIVGFGLTSEGGDAPDVLQQAQVPRIADATCAKQVGSSFENRTQLCAGYPEGGTDTCQGDSGGPMYSRTVTGALRVVGATSYGEGCARAGKPGVYARVADVQLREWIRGLAPAGVSD
jgi:secreted trypsin-like serine protease